MHRKNILSGVRLRNRKSFATLFVIGMLMITVLTASAATSIAVIDQAYTQPIRSSYSIQLMAPVGQEFTPTLPSLDTVNLAIGELGGNNIGADLQVLIREKSITGTVIDSSSITQLPDGFNGIASFSFPTPVSLTPGNQYVIEVKVVSGDNFGIGASYEGDYPGGQLIVVGKINPYEYAWFQEGLANYVPTQKVYCKDGGWKNLSKSDGTLFKTQGECVKYFNH